jgi:hypothetical protein
LLELVGPVVLGRLVGCADTVGAEVGLLLGWPVGEPDGCEVGGAEGRGVGADCGAGDSVGAKVGFAEEREPSLLYSPRVALTPELASEVTARDVTVKSTLSA